MGGERYYSFAKKNVRFFVLDTDSLDPTQMAWLEDALKRSTDEWKICYFHHPLYSDGGTHGSAVELRVLLEPLFVQVRRQRRVLGARPLLRAHHAAEGHLLLRLGGRRPAAAGRRRGLRS